MNNICKCCGDNGGSQKPYDFHGVPVCKFCQLELQEAERHEALGKEWARLHPQVKPGMIPPDVANAIALWVLIVLVAMVAICRL